MNKTIHICNNCGKQGHLFNQCKQPILSYGILLFHLSETGDIKYLMIRRRCKFGYMDFVRGKYLSNNVMYVRDLINEMNTEEKTSLTTYNFDQLWSQLWGTATSSVQNKNEKMAAQKKFDAILQNGIQDDLNHPLSLNQLLLTSPNDSGS